MGENEIEKRMIELSNLKESAEIKANDIKYIAGAFQGCMNMTSSIGQSLNSLPVDDCRLIFRGLCKVFLHKVPVLLLMDELNTAKNERVKAIEDES